MCEEKEHRHEDRGRIPKRNTLFHLFQRGRDRNIDEE
jgi:hypothetical protein